MSTGNPGLLLEPGRVEYGAALALQHRLVELRRRDEIPDTLVLLEHPPVITLGRNAGPENLLIAETELARRGAKLFRVERGGDVTFHGPGQLVGYPVCRLRSGIVGVRRFVELVEAALIRALAGLGVEAGLAPGKVGVWVGVQTPGHQAKSAGLAEEDQSLVSGQRQEPKPGDTRRDRVSKPGFPDSPSLCLGVSPASGPRKLASLGIAVRRSVTCHGFALNVTTDLGWFRLMNPCGMARVEMTSIEREGGVTDAGAVRDAVVRAFEAEFGREFRPGAVPAG